MCIFRIPYPFLGYLSGRRIALENFVKQKIFFKQSRKQILSPLVLHFVETRCLFFVLFFFFKTFLFFLFGFAISPLKDERLLGLGLKFAWPGFWAPPEPFTAFCLDFLRDPLLLVLFVCFSFFTDLFTRMDLLSSFEPSSASATSTESALCDRDK